MHLSLSSIGGTREEQLCILSAVLLWGVVAWLFTARAARKTNAAAAIENNLEAPLLDELWQLGLKQLRLRAAAEGVDEDAIEDARDGDSPKEDVRLN